MIQQGRFGRREVKHHRAVVEVQSGHDFLRFLLLAGEPILQIRRTCSFE